MESGEYMLSSGVTLLALLVYFWNTVNVGRARVKYQVKAPAVTGAPEFERAFRVQQNMVEQLVMFLPALWLFAREMGDSWAAAIGLLWVIGRVVYSIAYAAAAEKRGAGFGISMLSTVVLLIGALVGWFV